MRLADADQRDDLLPTFQVWLQGRADTITLHRVVRNSFYRPMVWMNQSMREILYRFVPNFFGSLRTICTGIEARSLPV